MPYLFLQWHAGWMFFNCQIQNMFALSFFVLIGRWRTMIWLYIIYTGGFDCNDLCNENMLEFTLKSLTWLELYISKIENRRYSTSYNKKSITVLDICNSKLLACRISSGDCQTREPTIKQYNKVKKQQDTF